MNDRLEGKYYFRERSIRSNAGKYTTRESISQGSIATRSCIIGSIGFEIGDHYVQHLTFHCQLVYRILMTLEISVL